jgi:hypothetical protein
MAIKIDKTFLSLLFGVLIALVVGWFSYQLWFNPIAFTEGFAPPLAVVDYGSLIRARWIANRILPWSVVLLLTIVIKEYRAAGYLLLMRVGVDFFDAFVMTLALMNGHPHGNKAFWIMVGAYILTIVNAMAAVYLIRKPVQSPAPIFGMGTP